MADYTAAGWEVQQFTTSIQMLLGSQTGPSRLRGTISEGQHTGESASPVNYIGPLVMNQATSLNVPITHQDPSKSRRWVVPSVYDVSVLKQFHEWVKSGMDPQGALVQRVASAAAERIDEIIAAAFFATALTGEQSTSGTTAFEAGQQVAVNYKSAANVGLTLEKVKKAAQLFKANYFGDPTEQVYIAMSSLQWLDLMREDPLLSHMYGANGTLATGRLPPLLGLQPVVTEQLPVDGSSYRRVAVYTKSSMHLGVWMEPSARADLRTDLRGIPTQLYLQMSLGATRLQEKGVVEIKCSEA